MKTKVLLASIITFLATFSANAQWFQQQSGTTLDLNCVHCLNDTTCYAVGALTAVRKTINGGSTAWTTPGGSPGFTNKLFVKMLNKDTVLIGQSNGTFRKTTIASTTTVTAGYWSNDIFGGNTNMGLYDATFNSKTNFVSVGGTSVNPSAGGHISTTSTNTGANWTAVNISGEPTFYGIHALTTTTYVVCGGMSSVYKSTDAGVTWTAKRTGSATISLFDISFPNPSLGYVVGGASTTVNASTNSRVFKSIDGGETWAAPLNVGLLPNTLYGVHFVTDSIGYVVGNGGKIQVTLDGGNHWTTQVSPVTTDLNKIYFTNDTVGYIAGNNGVILKTTSGGFIAPFVANAGTDKSVCIGGCTTVGTATSASGGTLPYTYAWSPVSGDSAHITVCPSANTMYTVTVTDALGNTTIDSVKVTIYPYTTADFTGLATNYCPITPTVTLTGVPAGGTFSGVGVTGNTFDPVATGSGTFTITYTYTDGNGCISDTTHSTNVLGAPTAVPICLATVDTVNSTTNIIMWEKPATTAIDSFYLYRKNAASVMVRIAGFKYSDPSKYVDGPSGINPMVQGETYALSTVDTCHVESALSTPHTTMFLKAPLFTPPTMFYYQWYDYKGITYPDFEIWRKTSAVAPWTKLHTSPFGQPNQDTDLVATTSSRYRIEIPYPAGCSSTLYRTYSNISFDETGVAEISLDKFLSVYPNPNHGTFTFELADIKYQTSTVKVVDMLGKVIYQATLKNNQKSEISIPGITPGIYQLQVITDQGIANKKITVQ
jgi:photosystem II stability/assembly factor-like uncharacterized protein